eukprot:11474003-Alexandrium_andersonii.AAC.1
MGPSGLAAGGSSVNSPCTSHRQRTLARRVDPGGQGRWKSARCCRSSSRSPCRGARRGTSART